MKPTATRLHASTLESIFSHLNANIILVNLKSEISYLNPSAERFLSISYNLAQNLALDKVFPHCPEILQATQEVLKNNRGVVIHELDCILNFQNYRLEIEISPLGEEGKVTGLLLWINEISTLQALQEEKRMLDRLSMMGTLASGLAHEIRNPLGGIRAAAEMLLRPQDAEDRSEYSHMILTEVDRLNRLIGELLNFSKPKILKKVPVNLNQILTEIVMLQRDLLHQGGIQIKEEFDPSLPLAIGDPDSLKQAFLNLIKNSMEAMPQGGKLSLATRFHSNLPLFFVEGSRTPIAEILIEDTGSGILESDMASLFTPFFTTKNHGTGLGLMMTQRIIKEHQGNLKVQSHFGKGTIFRVFLKLTSLSPKD